MPLCRMRPGQIASLMLALLLLAGCASSAGRALLPAQGGQAGKDLVVFLGDSLTAGYGVAPQDAYPAVIGHYWQSHDIGFRALNAGISGNKTTDVLARLDPLLTADVCLVFLEIGANDAFAGDDIDAIHARISEIIRRIQARGIPMALAALELPAGHPQVGLERAARYRRMYEELAREHAVPVMPFFRSVGRQDLWLPDSLHLNAEGNRLIARDVLAFLNPAWKLEP